MLVNEDFFESLNSPLVLNIMTQDGFANLLSTVNFSIGRLLKSAWDCQLGLGKVGREKLVTD